LSADTIVPGAGNPQAWNRYTFVFNNPLGYVDASGHIPYPITIGSFAPFKDFGGGYHGDERGYSTKPDLSSKVTQSIAFDTDKGTIRTSAYSHPSWRVANPEDKRTRTPRVQITSQVSIKASSDSESFSFSTWYGGSNPFVWYAPAVATEIDVFASFNIVENKKAGTLDITANLTGDNFPSTEAYITDPSGQSVFIGIGFYQGNNKETAPVNYLPFQNQRSISSLSLRILIDGRGNFSYVKYQGNRYTLDQWNGRFTAADPHDRRSFYGGGP
jgi:hypothetical protein